MRLLLLLFAFLFSYGAEVTYCQKAYYFIFPVGYSCATYKLEGDKLLLEGWTKSSFLGSVVKKLEVKSTSHSRKDLTSERFFVELKTPTVRKVHRYAFEGNKVFYEIVVEEEGKERQVKRGELVVSSPVDPFLAGILLYLTADEKKRRLKFFYDGREQEVLYQVVGEEKLERIGREWDTYKVLVEPKVKTSGFLVPKGKWLVWIDKKTRLPVRLKIAFTIGSANVWIDKLEGEEDFLNLLKPAR